MPTPLGYIVFKCDDPPTTLKVRLSGERPDQSAGYGGWQEVDRPRRVAVVSWQGLPLKRMSIPILFDNFVVGEGTPVEDDIDRLVALATPRKGGPPPQVTFDVAGRHVPNKSTTWVIDAIEWGDALMNTMGNRTRQAATVSLVEYVSDELVKERSPANAQRAKAASKKKKKGNKKGAREKRKAASRGKRSKAAHRSVTSASFEGEDLRSIAARELGDAQRWHEIAELNDIRDPRAIHVGQVLRLP